MIHQLSQTSAMVTDAGSPQGRSPPRRWAPWTTLFADIAGVVLRRLNLSDRKSWNLVCRSWRQLAKHSRPIPRLPVLFLSNLSCSSLSLSGTMTSLSTVDLPVVAQNCVGCYNEWMLVMNEDNGNSSDTQYTLINPFSKLSIKFPSPPSWSEVESLQEPKRQKFIPIENTLFFASYSAFMPREGLPPYEKAVFSVAPDNGSDYIAALTTPESLLLLYAGTWSICNCQMFTGQKDIVFLGGTLYLLMANSSQVFTFSFQQDQNELAITRIRKFHIKIPVLPNSTITRNILDWHGHLLLVVRSSRRGNTCNNVLNMAVFQLDLSAVPQYFQISDLNGDNLFLSSICSKVFAANLHDEVPGNKILAVDRALEQAVFSYEITDATTDILPINVPPSDQLAARKNLFWVFRV